MPYKKLVNLKSDHRDGLNDIQRQISEQGGKVSMMQLIVDAIQIFIDNYSDDAIIRYSPSYYEKKT